MGEYIWGLWLLILTIINAVSFWHEPRWWWLAAAIFFGIASIVTLINAGTNIKP